MKRALPFVIIALVALLTAGIATTFYRAKARPAPATAGPATPAQGEKREDESWHVRGARKAPVTIEIYGDFQCPSCARASGVVSEMEKQYGERLRVVFHEFPLAMHNHAVEAAMAAEAAGLQGHFWEMHDLLYQYQPVWSKVTDVGHFFDVYAASIGLDVERFRSDAKSSEVRARVISDGESGVVRGVKNTPTLFINGRLVRAALTREKLQAAIDEAFAAKKNS